MWSLLVGIYGIIGGRWKVQVLATYWDRFRVKGSVGLRDKNTSCVFVCTFPGFSLKD